MFRVLKVLFFFTALACIQQIKGQTLWIDHAATLVDKQSNICYASVKRNVKDALHFSVPVLLEIQNPVGEENVSVDSILVDSAKYKNGDVITVVANMSKHELVYSIDSKQDTLYFVLTSLPILTINKQDNSPFNLDTPVPTQFSVYDPYARTEDLTYFSSFANVSLRGATASLMEKKSYKVELADKDTNEDIDANLFGIRKSENWILDAAAIDYSRIRNRVCTDIWNRMSTLRDEDMLRNGTQGLYCELMIDGTYQGVYCFTDKINRSLLGLKKVKDDEENLQNAQVRGILYKCKGNDYGPSKLKKEETPWTRYNTEAWYDWYLKYPNDIYDERSWQPLYDLIEHTDQLSAAPDSVKWLTDCFYYDNFVEYAVFTMSMRLLDNVMHNSYLSVKNREKSFKVWITPWDMDGSLGRDGAAYVYNSPAYTFQVFGNTHPYRYYYDEQVQPFYDDFVRLMKQLHADAGPLSADSVSCIIDYYVDVLEQSGSWKRERERWDGIDNVWYHTPIHLTETLAEEAAFMKKWYKMNETYLLEKGNATSVGSVLNDIVQDAKYVYMLDGKKVNIPTTNNMPHGIYIKNGKKIIK